MMIPVLTDYYRRGRLPSGRGRSLSAFFPNCNLAVRREAVLSVGGYDEALGAAAEDADLCRRLDAAGWPLVYAPEAIVAHEPRPDLRSLMRQWFSYGRHGALFFRKHQACRFEVFATAELPPRVHRFRRIVAIPWSPVRGLVCLSPLSFLHAFAVTAVVSAVFRWSVAVAILAAAVVVLLVALRWSRPLRPLPLRDVVLILCVGSLIHLSCGIGSFLGGFRRRMLFFYPGG